MSRGIVLWPDAAASARIREIWKLLSAHGLPSMETHTHALHRPHCSLKVAEDLPIDAALAALGPTPRRPIRLHVESIGVFPPRGTLFLGCVVNQGLLSEQSRVHDAVASLLVRPWPYFELDAWVPHITLAWSMSPPELAAAIPLVMGQLPIRGTFDSGAVEDGTTGENWPSATP
jgi:hypothetical protein